MKKFICNLILGAVSVVCLGQNQKLSNYDSLKIMPPFKYYTLQGDTFTQDNLHKKRKTVIIYFNPDCGYCEKEAKYISQNLNKLPGTLFILLSQDDNSALKKFSIEHKLDKRKRIIVLNDKDKLYCTFTIAHVTPSIHIYDKDKNLIHFSDGAMEDKELLKYLK